MNSRRLISNDSLPPVRLGLDYELLASGCCGMAGSYEVSMTAALLPRVQAASPDTIVLANGFSCREQIEQATGRKTTHIAELISQGFLEPPVSGKCSARVCLN
jgi:hypothetical protein